MSNYDDDITIRDETVEYILNVMNIQDPYTIHEDETATIKSINSLYYFFDLI